MTQKTNLNFLELLKENSWTRLNFILNIDYTQKQRESNPNIEISSKVFQNISNLKEACSKNNFSSNRINKFHDINYFLGSNFLTKSIDKHSFSKQYLANDAIKRSKKLNKSVVGLKSILERYPRMSKDKGILHASPKKIYKNKSKQPYKNTIPFLKYKKNISNLSFENIMYKNPYEPIYMPPAQTQKNDKLQTKFRMRKYNQFDDNKIGVTYL